MDKNNYFYFTCVETAQKNYSFSLGILHQMTEDQEQTPNTSNFPSDCFSALL